MRSSNIHRALVSAARTFARARAFYCGGGGRLAALAALVGAALLLGSLLPDAETAEAQTAPTVTAVAITSSAGPDQTYVRGQRIRVALTFSEAVDVSGAPQVSIDMDPAYWGTKSASYLRGSGSTELTFAHTVVEPNYSSRGVAVLADSLTLNGGSITSSSSGAAAALSHAGLGHDANHRVNWQAVSPTVTGVAITSDSGEDEAYRKGDAIVVTLSFSEAVAVSGAPSLELKMDPGYGVKRAAYSGGSGTTALTFSYTVVEPNFSTQGVAVLANSLKFNGGAIRSVGSQTDVNRSHSGLGHDANHLVDWQRTSNRAPVVNSRTWNYNLFTGTNNAPRGVLVSKPFYGIFSDPDGDELTYAFSITGGDSQLVDELRLTLDAEVRRPHQDLPPIGTYDRVWFTAEAEADWNAASPALADPQIVTVTLTATDPSGVTASINGDFKIDWDSFPVLESAIAQPAAIVLTYDRELRASPAPAAEQFTVHVVDREGSVGTVEVTGVSLSDAAVTLTLASALKPNQTVSLDFTGSAEAPLQRAVGGDPAPGFSRRAISVSLPALRVPVCDRTPSVRDLLSRLTGKECADVTAADLVEIEKFLWWHLEDVTSLRSGDFEGLYNLKLLNLSKHQLRSLPERIFDDLHSLEELDLSVWAGPYSGAEGLRALPSNVFANLSNLKELDLEGNRLGTLPGGTFNGLSSLQTLSLYTTSLTELPEDVFDGLSSLQTLNLQHNKLSTLPDGVLDGLSNLRTLNLRRNDLVELPNLDGLSSLEVLNLGSNRRMNTLPEDAFEGLSSLQALHIRCNRLSALHEDVFDDLGDTLQTLDLGCNKLKALPEDVFAGLTNLQTLILDDNRLISALHEDLFDGLSSLQTLNLRMVFDDSYTLYMRHLHGVDVTAMPADLFDGLSSLQTLNLGTNGLGSLHEDIFDGLSTLESLDLSVNALSELPDEVLDGLTSLRTLNMRWNYLTELPEDVFYGLSSLQSLDLMVNDLTELPEGVFDDMSSLQTLSLRSNELAELPAGVFAELSNLQSLDLSENPGTPFDLTGLGVRTGVTVKQ
ncbi:MAG: leucine-rich repeat protein [Chloroflexi bacterium]|nr:leucine-rich repeat protein [Chloroflexota bacterium]